MEHLVYIIIGMVVCITILLVGLVKKQLSDIKYKDTPESYRAEYIDVYNWGMAGVMCGVFWPVVLGGATLFGAMAGLIKVLESVAKRIANAVVVFNKVVDGE